MSTFTDGAPPSVTPGPDDGDPADLYLDRDEDPTDSGSAWLQEEIQRRIAAGRRASKGRHSRHEVASSTSSISYVPRHSTATPGPGALPPAPLATPARGIPRLPAAWSDPEEGEGGADGPGRGIGPAAANGQVGGGPTNGTLADRAATNGSAPEQDPPTGGHRRTILGGGVAVVPVEGAPPPWRSGDPLPAASVRKVRELAAPDPEDDSADTESVQSKRVRVVLSERKGGARPVRTVVDIQENTGVGELLRSNLIRSQLGVALRFAALAGITLGALPILFAMVPAIGRAEIFGLRVPWLLLGFLVYPFLFLIGLLHTRTAERVEQNFADHVQD